MMPTPVDDSVALVYKDRYIYLVSGWHNSGNVTNVQVLDTKTKAWFEATPFPGEPVFGHAAGIINNNIVIADGVKVAKVIEGRRQYEMSSVSYQGIIDPKNIKKIRWKKLPPHPGKAKYRMAAVGINSLQQVVFAAGSDNPYNYNGIGYNGTPSIPSNEVFSWDVNTHSWQVMNPLSVETMDHRGLLNINDTLYILGGMHSNQQVSNKVITYEVEK